jgi:hypothetical protein
MAWLQKKTLRAESHSCERIFPQPVKPRLILRNHGAAQAAPFQNRALVPSFLDEAIFFAAKKSGSPRGLPDFLPDDSCY